MLVIFHFIMHTVKIISVYVHILPKPHNNVLNFEENEKAVVFDIIFLWLFMFLTKQKRGIAV